MKLKTFFNRSVGFYKSGKCLYLKSGPGRGKTSTILAAVPHIATSLGKNLGVSTISGPLLTPADAVGYLVPVNVPAEVTPEGKVISPARVESHYTDPFWWRTDEGKRLEEYDGGVIFVDEMDKTDVDVKKVIGEMALSGRCGPHKLPKGWVVWMAGNRAGDRSGSTKELDHLINRRFEVDVTDDLEGWKDWAVKHGVHYAVIAFAMDNADIVFPAELPKEQGPFCTPRSLVATAELLATFAGSNGELPMDDDAVEMAAAGIGQAAAAQLFATIKLDAELPKIETILGNPSTAKLPGAPDAQMLTCYKLAHLADDKTLDPFITYVERLPADFAITFAKSLCTRSPLFAAKPAMLAWSKRNSGIMAMMSTIK